MIATRLAHALRPSPNIEPRRGNARPDILLLHYTGMESAAKACDWLCDERSHVSCHYLIDEAGAITQMVDEEMRAWHAGASSWHGESDINSRSIGIEIHNPGHDLGYRDFPQAQMDAVAALSRDIVGRHRIRSELVLAHSDVAPGRKIDPGERFDWRMLHAAGVGHWIEPEPIGRDTGLALGAEGREVEALQMALAQYGYGIAATGRYDERTASVVAAFQLHFRQAKIDGIADRSTIETLRRLINSGV